jgi:hypothetical protein
MSEPRKLRPIEHGYQISDQVVRLEQFRRRCPGVTILSPRQTGTRDWFAEWDEQNGSTTVTRPELRQVLDILEERFGGPE